MLSRIRRFVRDEKQWHSDHRSSWSGMVEPGPDGMTQFQGECERAIVETLSDRGLSLRERTVEGDSERFVVAQVPELSATVWIYSNQTDIDAPGQELRLEQWDTRTPEDHYERVLAFLSGLPLVEEAPNTRVQTDRAKPGR